VKNRGSFIKSGCKIAVARSAVISSKCTTNCLAAGLCSDLLGKLTALPQTPWLSVWDPCEGTEGEWNAKGRRKGRRGKGKDGEPRG